jgi:hypothetical protein
MCLFSPRWPILLYSVLQYCCSIKYAKFVTTCSQAGNTGSMGGHRSANSANRNEQSVHHVSRALCVVVLWVNGKAVVPWYNQ